MYCQIKTKNANMYDERLIRKPCFESWKPITNFLVRKTGGLFVFMINFLNTNKLFLYILKCNYSPQKKEYGQTQNLLV